MRQQEVVYLLLKGWFYSKILDYAYMDEVYCLIATTTTTAALTDPKCHSSMVAFYTGPDINDNVRR